MLFPIGLGMLAVVGCTRDLPPALSLVQRRLPDSVSLHWFWTSHCDIHPWAGPGTYAGQLGHARP